MAGEDGARTFLTSGSLRGLLALGRFGRPLHAFFVPLRELVTRELGADTAALLAEPVIDERLQRVDWYASLAGPVAGYLQLGAAERARLEVELEAGLGRLRALGRSCTGDADPVSQGLGGILIDAAATPAAANVFVVGGRPVVAFWGFVPDALPDHGQAELLATPGETGPTDAFPRPSAALSWPVGEDEGLAEQLGLGEEPAAVGEAPADTEVRRVAAESRESEEANGAPPASAPSASAPLGAAPGRPALGGWIVPWAGVLLGGSVVLAACLFWLLVAWSHPEPPADLSAALAAARQREAVLRGQLDPLVVDSLAQRLHCAPGLVIPPGAASVAFLAGRWSSAAESGGADGPLVAEYTFDGRGRGIKTVVEADGGRCSTPVVAKLEGGRLRIEDLKAPRCPGGRDHARGTLTCRPAGGEAACEVAPDQGPAYAVSMRRDVS
jgi:hypothetical protein